VDDYNSFMWLTLLSTKDEAEMEIHRIKASAEVQGGCILHPFRTDRSGEFTSHVIEGFCINNGVQRHLTAPSSL
jgi:hypothetical protein